MTKEQAIQLIKDELKRNALLGIDTGKLYVSVHQLDYYLGLMYGVGFDEGRTQRQITHSIKVGSMSTLDGEVIATYESIVEASRLLDIHKSQIGRSIKKNYRCAGYYWKYL